MITYKCHKNCCDIFVPSYNDLRHMSYESRMKVFMFAASGERSWLQPDTFVLPAEFNRIDDDDDDEFA